jgi:Flp pilus assembly protein TadG
MNWRREPNVISTTQGKPTDMYFEEKPPVSQAPQARCHRWPKTRGVTLVEFALVLPILTALLIGTVWIGRAVSVYQALERAAREGARVAIAPACALCGGAKASTTQINNAVKDALQGASLDPSNPALDIDIAWSQPLDSNDPANYRASGVEVTVSYPMRFTIPFVPQSLTNRTLTSSVSMRQEF